MSTEPIWFQGRKVHSYGSDGRDVNHEKTQRNGG